MKKWKPCIICSSWAALSGIWDLCFTTCTLIYIEYIVYSFEEWTAEIMVHYKLTTGLYSSLVAFYDNRRGYSYYEPKDTALSSPIIYVYIRPHSVVMVTLNAF